MRFVAAVAAFMMVAATDASAQEPRTLWEGLLPGNGAITALGGLGGGRVLAAGRGPAGPRLVQLDDHNRIIDDWTLPGSDAWPRAVATPPGAALVAAGPAEPATFEHGMAAWRLRLGPDGHLKQDWLRRFRRTALDGATAAVALNDGGAVVAGWTGGEGAWLVRLDAEGEVNWRRLAAPPSAGGRLRAEAAALSATGDILVAAYGAPGAEDPGGVWVLHLDGGGADRSQMVIDEGDDEHPAAMTAFPDGGLAVAGWVLPVVQGVRAANGQEQAWLVRLDGTGRILWDHRWPESPGRMTAIVTLPDGGVLAAGQVGGSALLARLDADGRSLWEWRRPGAALNALTLLEDGTAAAAGDKRNRPWMIRFAY